MMLHPITRIRPRIRKSRCYELCGRYQLGDVSWTLVHGSVQEEHRLRIDHAWLKRDGWVYDAVLDRSFPELTYLHKFAAVEVATFSPEEAARRMVETGHHGPWRERPS
jgi:hypothetical protein